METASYTTPPVPDKNSRKILCNCSGVLLAKGYIKNQCGQAHRTNIVTPTAHVNRGLIILLENENKTF